MKLFRLLVLAGLLLSALGVWSVAAYQKTYAGRIFPGVSLAGLDVGGLTLDEANNAVRARLAGLSGTYTLRDGDQRYFLTPAELGIRYDDAQLLDAALALGRGENWAENLLDQLDLMLNGRSISGAWSFDEGAAQVALRRLARQIERAPRDARVYEIGLQVFSEPSVTGRVLDVTETIERIRRAMPLNPRDEIELVVNEVPPVVREAGDVPAQLRAILAAPIRLTLSEPAWLETGKSAAGLAVALVPQERAWTLDSAMLASLVSVRSSVAGDRGAQLGLIVDDQKLTVFLNAIAAQVERKPRDARFYFDESIGKLIPLVASQQGRTLDVPATVQRIKQQLTSENRVVPLVVKTIKPVIALEDADQFNIKELVVAGTTSFKGSSPERVQNIVVATNQFHGIVLAPGQEFSFDQYLGDVYEPPIGLDATVYAPQVDFRFVNDTANYLLIQPSVNLKESTLTFKFFGTKNNRTVEMEGPTITNVIPHGPDIRENDPTLPVGVVKQVDFAYDGKTVVVNRVVKEGEKVLRRDKFVSVYRPWQARFLVGTRS
ncbi:MAG: peptidoglycan binding domain-containing protein [Chloroflexi bacterium]|nr:peptidoglycan binding domain-containing protein [Chloroflexota bacterium]